MHHHSLFLSGTVQIITGLIRIAKAKPEHGLICKLSLVMEIFICDFSLWLLHLVVEIIGCQLIYLQQSGTKFRLLPGFFAVFQSLEE